MRSFYRGDKTVDFVEEIPAQEEEEKTDENRVIPIVDHYAVKAARRKIILDQLKKA